MEAQPHIKMSDLGSTVLRTLKTSPKEPLTHVLNAMKEKVNPSIRSRTEIYNTMLNFYDKRAEQAAMYDAAQTPLGAGLGHER
jgi:hypothetical protein